MPLITATWKVTHTSVILLDTTDYMQDEPKLARAFVSDRVASLGASGIVNFGRLNVSHVGSFTRVIVFDNDWQARAFMRTHTLALPTAPADCTILWINEGVTTTLSDCVITGYNARCENNFFFADYSLQGGTLT
jgi:hypothetical protein